jgi:hypothetical protein
MWHALILAAAAAPSVSPPPTLPPCVTDTQIDAHIDPRLPSWMRVEIRAVMLTLPPCARRGTVASDDSQGRYITNDYNDYMQYVRDWGGEWARIDSEHWRAPDGHLINMPYEPIPAWLVGQWSCTGQRIPPILLVLRADSSGAVHDRTTSGGVNEQGKFVEAPARTVPIKLYAYRTWPLPTVYAGMQNNGLAYSVQRTSNGLALRNWGFFRDDTWNAMPTQPEWVCTRDGSAK